MDSTENKIDCYHCVHFTVTWNPSFPRACRLYGFQGKELPSVTVLKTTGSVCAGFEKKRHRGSD